jgi:D-beta-D-heptose 7-phosphate kinase/D-beta-D-heptose 1-phosphate adenosyltransferase
MIKILVVGESCTDRFIYCETSRFSPEAPVPVLVPLETIENLGMSGNVVRNLLSLDNLDVTHIHQNNIITKTRYVEKKSNHMFLRIDEGEKYIDTFNPDIDLQNYDIVIVSDYHKGFLSDKDLINIGKSSKLSILDSKRKLSEEIIKSYSFIKLNESEFNNNLIFKEMNNIIVTLGSKGCLFRGVNYSSPNPQETIDVSGAGDTFTSCFILKYFKSKNIEESIIYANKMSSIVVSKRGVATPI